MSSLNQPTLKLNGPACRAGTFAICCASIVFYIVAPAARAATTWDSQDLTMEGNPAGSGTQWWFDPFNWSPQDPADDPPYFLPPTADGTSTTDVQINAGTATLPGGEGVVYHPDEVNGDPHFGDADTLQYPAGYGPQTIHHLYMSRGTSNHNLLTIKGDLTILGNPIIGRSGSSAGEQNLATVVQLGGTVSIPQTHLDIGQRETSGWGNGVYDYRGGILDNAASTTNIRLSHGSASNGTGGHGRFIMHNPGDEAGGYVRGYNMMVASNGENGDGVLTGVGIVEFHLENGGTRPIQIRNNLSINNGLSNNEVALRSSRLELVLQEAPMVDGNGIPQDLGLFDVNFGGIFGGSIQGTGDLDGDDVFNNDRVFSSADATRHYYPRSAWTRFPAMSEEDFLLEATFGGTLYRWEVSYTGSITWVTGEENDSAVQSISGTGGVDVVLLGHSSIDVGLPGDFNNDGKVDAADYVYLRKNNAPAGDFTTWRTNFGAMSGGGAGAGFATATVPEPGTLTIAISVILATTLLCRRPLKPDCVFARRSRSGFPA